MKNSIYDGLKVFHRQKQDISNSDKSIDISSNSLQKLLTLIVPSLEDVIIHYYSLIIAPVIFLLCY